MRGCLLLRACVRKQVPEEEAVLYNRDKVRRPVPEYKAISKAVEMIRV